jgi:hypothetical protein
MNFEKVGLNICKITTKTPDKTFVDIPVFMANKEDEDKIKHSVDDINVTEKNEIMQHLPYHDKSSGNMRQILYVSGASGSGKSYYTSSYMKEYHKMFPKNPIYIFSSLTEDKKLDEVKNTKRFKLDEAFYNTAFSIKDFSNCLVVYDDTEMISNPMIQEKICNIRDLILTTGRHTSTYMIVTSHNTNAGHKTKLILLESHCITLFLNTMGERALKYLLESSFGFSKKQIEKVKELNSRWVTIFRTAPITIMHEKGIFVLNKKLN